MNICSECLDSTSFSAWIEESGTKGTCDFDSTHKTGKVVPVKEFAEYIDEYFRETYQIAESVPDWSDDSDKVRYECDGETLEEILSNDLRCEGKVLDEIIDNLINFDYKSIARGAEDFYSTYDLYESIADAEQRWGNDLDYYEIEAALTATDSLLSLGKNLDLLTSLIQKNDELEPDLQKFQMMMTFTFCITSLETYLADTFIRTVYTNEAVKKIYVFKWKPFKETKISLNEIYNELKKIDKRVKDELIGIIFHNLGNIKPIYRDVLKIDIGDIAFLSQCVNKRHDFVHRGGKDKEGKEITTSKEEILKMIQDIYSMCTKIDAEIQKAPWENPQENP